MIERFDSLPCMVLPYCKVVTSRKPLLATADMQPQALQVSVERVSVRAAHLRRYQQVCGIEPSAVLPPAYLHVLAMPLHMRLFTHPAFPVKVLGLVHLRNLIRLYQPIPIQTTLQLSAEFTVMRATDSGQEYDIVTRAHRDGELVWQEVSTMLARRPTLGKRPSIERAVRNETSLEQELTVAVAAATGRRYAMVSGDFNPIHLFDRTAQAFQFKQCVAHGMWSLARCLGLAQGCLADTDVSLAASFKLPIYLPSDVVFRQQQHAQGKQLTLSTPKGDRLHLVVHIS